jgi:PPM family protein phosphatase
MAAVSIGLVCHVGVGERHGGRRRNEDNALVCADDAVSWTGDDGQRQTVAQPGEGVLVAVCDGMGGHRDGHVAALTAAKVLAKLYQPGAPKQAMRALTNWVQESHRTLHRAASQKGPVVMGTTLTAGWIVGGHLVWVHVGDSRLYLWRAGRLFRLSSDHTRNEFARRDGRALTADGEHLAQSFIYGSRGLGNDLLLRIDKGVDSGTEILQKEDRILVCSDGVSGVLEDDRIGELLGQARSPQGAADALFEAAADAGSVDNITALVVRIDEDPGGSFRAEEWTDDTEETIQF